MTNVFRVSGFEPQNDLETGYDHKAGDKYDDRAHYWCWHDGKHSTWFWREPEQNRSRSSRARRRKEVGRTRCGASVSAPKAFGVRSNVLQFDERDGARQVTNKIVTNFSKDFLFSNLLLGDTEIWLAPS
jgi:hypothetical protein